MWVVVDDIELIVRGGRRFLPHGQGRPLRLPGAWGSRYGAPPSVTDLARDRE